ncbi:HOOK protein-domain-containing protein [Syncephalis plumigaleata]|nr:HOOK protein-domain-containing protein [Syncephalis plumigaleata]
MEAENVAAGFVEWVNSFDNLPHPVNHAFDLVDGIVLHDILLDIDPKWFKTSKPSESNDKWVLKFNNLKKIYKVLTRYYEEVLGFPAGFPAGALVVPNLNAIAKDNDLGELVRLLQLVIALAVQCPRNQVYIEKIQGLSQESQHALMLAIEEVMSSLSTDNADAESDLLFSPTVSRTDATSTFEITETDEQVYRIQMEYNQILAQKRELESTHHGLIEEHGELRTKYDEALAEREDLRSKIRDLERTVASAHESGKHDYVLRAEIDQLRFDLDRCETKLNESEMQIESQNATIMDLNRKLEDANRKADLAAKLKDQLQEYRHTSEKLQKAEVARDKYKKRLEETSDYRRQIKTLEEQNFILAEKNQEMGDEYRKVSAYKPMIESYKEQLQQLQTKSNQLAMEKNRLEFDLRGYQEKLTLFELEKQNDSEQIAVLNDRLRELELGGGQMIPTVGGSGGEGGDDDDDINAGMVSPTEGERMDNVFSGRNQFELRSKIVALEHEIHQLRHNKDDGGASQRIVLLETEEDYLASHQKNMTLENEIARLKNAVATGLDHDVSLQLRSRLNQSEEQLATTKRRLAELEVELSENKKELVIAKSNLTLIDKDKLDALAQIRNEASQELGDLEKTHAMLKERCSELETESQRQLERITQLLEEKDQLQCQVVQHKDQLLEKEQNNSNLKQTLAVLESKEQAGADEIRRQLMLETQRNVKQQDQIAQQQEQIHQLQVKMQKAKEFIRQQDRMFKESRTGPIAPQETFEEAVTSLRSELRKRDEEIARLKTQVQETRTQARREQQLVVSAWYEIGRRMQSTQYTKSYRPGATPQPPAPVSWLGQQRRTLDMQTRRR